MKKIIVIAILIVIVGIIIYRNTDNYDGLYEIYVEKLDDLSPDRHLIVKRNDKKTSDYKYIVYKKDEKRAILCYSNNPTVNVYSLDIDELIIVLPNEKEVIAKVMKEEK